VKNYKLHIVFLLLIIFYSTTSALKAQMVKAEVDRDKILIGEQIKLKLTVQTDRPVGTWFQFPDSINHIEVVKRSKIDTLLNGRYTSYIQTINITSFDSGTWQFPALSIATISQSTGPIIINVLPVDVSKLEDYHDIKEIEEVKQENDPVIIAIIVSLTLISIAIVIWLITKKKKLITEVPVLKSNVSPLQWALTELDKLQQQALYKNNRVKKHYSEVTNISKKFFHLLLQQQSMHQTTDEWMLYLKSIPVDGESKTSFLQLLRLADAVKFAKYHPPMEENEQSIETTKIMLRQVAEWQQNSHVKYQPKS
jgi:hypothetical protein